MKPQELTNCHSNIPQSKKNNAFLRVPFHISSYIPEFAIVYS